jgi:hypothetical protein
MSASFLRAQPSLVRKALIRLSPRTRPDDSQRWWRSADTPSRAFGASPFRPRSIGLCLVGRHPIRSKGAYSSGPGLNETLTFPLSAASMARPSARRKKSRGDTKAGAPRRFGVKEERHRRITTVTWRLNIQGTPTSWVVTVKEISGGLV